MDSILESIKKLLGFDEEYEAFDQDIIMHINSTFFTLSQLGVGPTPQFTIADSTATWDKFMKPEDGIEAVKTYIYQKLRLIFDPPTTSFAIAAIEKMTEEYEWRLNVHADKTW